jgi:hypothetical protein
MKWTNYILATAAVLFFTVNASAAVTVLSSEEASRIVKFENLNMSASRVSGVIANQSPHPVKDVEILIQYHWLWENERNPGTNSPGRAAVIKLDQTLKPGESIPFSYSPSPELPSRSDGRFMPEVDIAGFSVIIPAGAPQAHSRR